MAITPFGKMSSEDILSAHITGLGSAINNIELALDMQTKVVAGLVLEAVTDMEDVNDRYKIYEVAKRCWLVSPAPVVKRNGVVVSKSEYIIQPAYGVVVFHIAQKASDIISVDVTYIDAKSTKLDTVDKDVSTIKEDITTIKKQISEIDSGGSSGGSGQAQVKWFNGQIITSKTGWFSNYLKIPKQPTTAYTSTKWINDFVPVVVTERTVIDKLRFWFTSTSSSDAETVMAIYDTRYDLGFPYPKNCLGKTTNITLDSSSPEGWKDAPLYVYDPIGNSLGELEVVLEPGIYWIGKATYDTLSSKGFHKIDDNADVIKIMPPEGGFPSYAIYGTISGEVEAYAVRAKMTSWSLPASFPSPSAGTIGLYGTGITNVFMRKAR